MISKKLPDGSFITTPIYIGEESGRSRFIRHEKDDKHQYVSDKKLMKGDDKVPDDYHWIQMQHCDCGAMRSQYSTDIEHQRVPMPGGE